MERGDDNMRKIKENKFIIMTIIVVIITLCFGTKAINSYYTHKDAKINKFQVGDIKIRVDEGDYVDNQIIKPGGSIEKAPKVINEGSVPCYIRVQVYVPVKNMDIVGGDEQIIKSENGVELFTLNQDSGSGWEEIKSFNFPSDDTKTEGNNRYYTNGEGEKCYVDEDGNIYRVRTFKYMKDGSEKVVAPGETIEEPVFSSVQVVNYLDIDKEKNANSCTCCWNAVRGS